MTYKQIFSEANSSLKNHTNLDDELARSRGQLYAATDRKLILALLQLVRKLVDSMSNSTVRLDCHIEEGDIPGLLSMMRELAMDALPDADWAKIDAAYLAALREHIAAQREQPDRIELSLEKEIAICRELIATSQDSEFISIAISDECRKLCTSEEVCQARLKDRLSKAFMLKYAELFFDVLASVTPDDLELTARAVANTILEHNDKASGAKVHA